MSWNFNEIKCASKTVSDVLGSDKYTIGAARNVDRLDMSHFLFKLGGLCTLSWPCCSNLWLKRWRLQRLIIYWRLILCGSIACQTQLPATGCCLAQDLYDGIIIHALSPHGFAAKLARLPQEQSAKID
jgi:hypothetical protein